VGENWQLDSLPPNGSCGLLLRVSREKAQEAQKKTFIRSRGRNYSHLPQHSTLRSHSTCFCVFCAFSRLKSKPVRK